MENIENIKAEIKEIESMIYKLYRKTQLLKMNIDGRIPKPENFKENIELIIQEIFDTYGINIKENSRKRQIVTYRNCFLHIIYKTYKVGLSEVAGYVDRTDHATIIHSKKMVDQFLKMNDEEYSVVYSQVLTIAKKHLIDLNQ